MNTIIYSVKSTNGRWGTDIVGPEELKERCRAVIFTLPGRVEALGETAGRTCFRFVPDSTFIVVGENLVVVEGAGCECVHSQGLQSHSSVTILHAQEHAVFKSIGYKGRSATYYIVKAGGLLEKAPAALLLDAGIVQPREVPAPTPPPSQFNSSFADALRKAGLK